MAKIWQTKKTKLHPVVEQYTVGNDYILDQKLLPFDVEASRAHAKMLVKIGVIKPAEMTKINKVFNEILKLHQQGKFKIKLADEDCHTAIENFLIKKLGSIGKKVHTARSRNDQVLVATRLYTKNRLKLVSRYLVEAVKSILAFAKKYEFIPMPGYTHTQRAMCSSVGHWASAFVEALIDDHKLLETAYWYNDMNPLGSAAGFGVSLRLDRGYTTKLLGFQRIQKNSLYCQNSRGKVESFVASCLAQIMMTLGKIANDLVWFNTYEFNFFSVTDQMTTGSSIMPQKKNLDVMELLRANSGLILTYQTQLQELGRNLPSGYNRDLQLSKETLFKALGIARESLKVMALMFKNLRPNKRVLVQSLSKELFITNEVFKLVKKGIPFREAYQRIKENIDNIKIGNLEKRIKENISLGAVGNLDLDSYKVPKSL